LRFDFLDHVQPFCSGLILPEVLKPIRRECSVPRRVLDVLVPEILPEGVCMASMMKEDARQAILSEYDRWANKHPNDGSFDTYRMKGRTFSISVQATSGKSFTAGFGIGCKINADAASRSFCRSLVSDSAVSRLRPTL
jgi:hypothetical protein